MTQAYALQDQFMNAAVYTWIGLTIASPDGQPAGYAGTGDRTMQVTGTFGASGAVYAQGSLDGVNWFQLHDPSNTLISFTAAGLKAILENCNYVRPYVNAGDGTTNITAVMAVRRNQIG